MGKKKVEPILDNTTVQLNTEVVVLRDENRELKLKIQEHLSQQTSLTSVIESKSNEIKELNEKVEALTSNYKVATTSFDETTRRLNEKLQGFEFDKNEILKSKDDEIQKVKLDSDNYKVKYEELNAQIVKFEKFKAEYEGKFGLKVNNVFDLAVSIFTENTKLREILVMKELSQHQIEEVKKENQNLKVENQRITQTNMDLSKNLITIQNKINKVKEFLA